MDYEKLKNFISGHKGQLLTLAACAVMFVVGFGTGKAVSRPDKPQSQRYPNYTTNPAAKPGAEGDTGVGGAVTKTPTAGDKPAKQAITGKPPAAGEPCPVKGNISAKKKIYHIKGGAFYDRVTPEQCFNTETEAQAAGFRKSGR